jgi:hypothetical protein
VEGALFRQSEDLTKRFNDEAAATKRDFEQRFEQVRLCDQLIWFENVEELVA